MLVKCKCHGIKINRDNAFKVVINGKNNYYCSEEDYKKHQHLLDIKDKVFQKIFDIFEYQPESTVLYKEINDLSKVHSYDKMFEYLVRNEDYLNKVMHKDFKNEFCKIRYFAAILKNQLLQFRETKPETKKQIDFEMCDTRYKSTPRKKSLNEFLNEVGEDYK